MLTLEVLICTIDDRINQIIDNLLPPVSSIKYLISWQQTGNADLPVPHELEVREDVRVSVTRSKGLSRNRNNALAHAEGDLLLLSDDDTRYQPCYFQRVADAFEAHPEADILTFQMVDEHGKLMKPYPDFTYDYAHRPKGSYVSSIEIAMRKRAAALRFDLRFGLGSEYLGCGEEEVFIHEADNSGYQIAYIPQIVVQTVRGTTGSRFLTDVNVRHAKGAVLYIIHGYLGALLRCLKLAMTLHCGNRFRIFKDLHDGISYIRNTPK